MSEEKSLNRPKFEYIEPAGGVHTVYANHLGVFWSGVDVTLIFGELTHSRDDVKNNVLHVENKTKVTIPWSVAKLVLTNLKDVIGRYEEANGELRLPGEYKIPQG